MSKARELAELSRTVSDSADAVAITIDSSENVSFANGIDVTGTTTTANIITDEDQSGLLTLGRFSSGFAYSLIRPSTNATGLEIRTFAGNALARFLNTGVTELYHDGAAKLATASTGIDVTGSVTADSLTVDGRGIFTAGAPDPGDGSAAGVALGYDTSNGFGFIQAIQTGVANKPLRIQPLGTDPIVMGVAGAKIGITGQTSPTFNLDGGFVTQTWGWHLNTSYQAGFTYTTTDRSLSIFTKSADNADYIRFSTGGSATERARITAAGILQLAGGGNDSVGEINFGNTAQNANRLQIRHQSSSWIVKTVDSEPLLFGTSNSERMRVESNGSVGIGTQSPTSKKSSTTLQVNGNIAVGDNNATGILAFGDVASAGVNVGIFRGAAGPYNNTNGNSLNLGAYDAVVFTTGNADIASQTERMRITASGHTTFGTTDLTPANNSVNGTAILSDGRINHNAQSQAASTVGRTGTNGDLVDFKKNGTTVGRIGTDGNDIFIGSDDTNILFFQNGFLPANSVGGTRDNASDIGAASARFKDLYLAGGVFLGGTGSANQMEDYEEGAWTPTLQSFNGTFSVQSASYRKIGQICFASFHLDISTSHTGTNANLVVTGLPFATQNYGSVYGMATSMHCNLWATVNKPDNGIMGPGSNVVSFYKNTGQTGIYAPSLSDIGTGNFLCCIVFPTG